jgi:D-beta-D-heptose 7-phosphate kinase/D-beta-D-heptose 1-phosphate adenosyltransferase
MERSRLIHWVEKITQAHILVLGDVMLDRFIYGSVSRISPEAPVPVLRAAETRSALGGAGNVVSNLLALGSQVSFVSVVGDDHEAGEIRDMLSCYESVRSNLIVEQGRTTTVKTRFIAGRQQVLRVDRETSRLLEEESIEKVSWVLREYIDDCDAVVISDYGKGFICGDITKGVIACSRAAGKPVFIDPKSSDYTIYRMATVLTPNLKELGEAARLPVDNDESVVAAARLLLRAFELDNVLVTRGENGMTLVRASGEVAHLKGEAREVFDVSGAGDTAIAVTAATYSAGAPLTAAAELANIAAGIVVGKVGTAVVHPRDLIQNLRHQELSDTEAKIADIETAKDRVELWRRKGYRIGFTNGVFDLLHPAHLSLLSQASRTCDRLVVGLNSDASVKRIRGEGPLQHEIARSAILASLEIVDMVLIFQEETPVRLLESLRPDVLIKGSNYRPEEVVGAAVVKGYGGHVVLAHMADIDRDNSKITVKLKDIL